MVVYHQNYKEMSTYQYQITSFELVINTGPKSYQDREASIMAPLGNTGKRVVIGFYALPNKQIPSNGVYSSDFNVSLRSELLGAMLNALENGPLGFNFDMTTYKAEFGLPT
jgi:hypothetical protein